MARWSTFEVRSRQSAHSNFEDGCGTVDRVPVRGLVLTLMDAEREREEAGNLLSVAHLQAIYPLLWAIQG